MSASRIRQLCVRARQGSASARDQLLRAHIGLVIHIARYFYRPGMFMEFGDLVQQGCLGLLHAVEKFDPQKRSRGKTVRFATYAHYWVCHCIRREIENHGRTVAVPIDRLRAWKAEGREADVWLEDANGTALARRVDLEDHPDAWCRAWENRRIVESLLAKLSSRTQLIVRHRFGLDNDQDPLTQKQTGALLKISGTMVGQLERAALSRLRTLVLSFSTPIGFND